MRLLRGAYIVVRTSPLTRDVDEGEVIGLHENGKEIFVRVVRDALKGEREIWVVPHGEIAQ